MKRILSVLLVLSTLSSPSFGQTRVLEMKKVADMMILGRVCIGGYQFAVMCKEVGGKCAMYKNNNRQMEQILNEEGGGISC